LNVRLPEPIQPEDDEEAVLSLQRRRLLPGTHCPWDGWTADGIPEVLERCVASRGALDLAALIAGTPRELARRIVLIESADPDAVFESLVPDRCVDRGEALERREFARSLL